MKRMILNYMEKAKPEEIRALEQYLAENWWNYEYEEVKNKNNRCSTCNLEQKELYLGQCGNCIK